MEDQKTKETTFISQALIGDCFQTPLNHQILVSLCVILSDMKQIHFGRDDKRTKNKTYKWLDNHIDKLKELLENVVIKYDDFHYEGVKASEIASNQYTCTAEYFIGSNQKFDYEHGNISDMLEQKKCYSKRTRSKQSI